MTLVSRYGTKCYLRPFLLFYEKIQKAEGKLANAEVLGIPEKDFNGLGFDDFEVYG